MLAISILFYIQYNFPLITSSGRLKLLNTFHNAQFSLNKIAHLEKNNNNRGTHIHLSNTRTMNFVFEMKIKIKFNFFFFSRTTFAPHLSLILNIFSYIFAILQYSLLEQHLCFLIPCALSQGGREEGKRLRELAAWVCHGLFIVRHDDHRKLLA